MKGGKISIGKDPLQGSVGKESIERVSPDHHCSHIERNSWRGTTDEVLIHGRKRKKENEKHKEEGNVGEERRGVNRMQEE